MGTHTQLMRRGGIYAALVRRQAGAVLDQERDLAPHERQLSEGGGEHPHAAAQGGAQGGADSDAAAEGLAGGPAAAAGEGEPPEGPDSLPQWKQAQRLRAEHDPA